MRQGNRGNEVFFRIGQRIDNQPCIIRQLIRNQENNQIHYCEHKPSREEFLERSCRNHQHGSTTRFRFHLFHCKRSTQTAEAPQSPNKSNQKKYPHRISFMTISTSILKISVPNHYHRHHSIHQHHTKHIRSPILYHLLTAKIHKTRQTEKSIFYHRLLFLSVKQSGYLFRSSQRSIKKKFQI